MAEVLRWLGANPVPLSLDCRHTAQKVQFKLYSRETLLDWMSKLEAIPDNRDEPGEG